MRDAHPSLRPGDDLELKRAVAWNKDVIVLRGVLLPSSTDQETAALLLLLERIVVERAGHGWEGLDLDRFSPREKTVISLLAQGCTNKEIAARLKLSPYTVSEYMQRLMQKTSSPTRAALVAKVRWQQAPSRGTQALAEIGEPAAAESHETSAAYDKPNR